MYYYYLAQEISIIYVLFPVSLGYLKFTLKYS
jgi:hypothetical protein